MGHITPADFQYAVNCRRYLHQYPEQLFALDHTVAFVRRELEQMGIACAEAGPASVVGYIGPENCSMTVAFRADMDALPIQEETKLPFSSEVPGLMHACGHDSHTAVLLAVAKILKRHEADLRVRVKLLFQPSEEGAESGAKSMVEHGAVDDVDLVIGAHCDNELEVGTIGCCTGDYMTASSLGKLTFRGKKVHAATPELGVDAIAMAWEAYGELKRIVAEEAGADRKYLFGINCFHGGTAPNMVADCCEMMIAFRYYDTAFYDCAREACDAKCREIAEKYGGKVEIQWHTSAPPVHNDPVWTEKFMDCAEKALGRQGISLPPVRLSEDFSWFLREKPGLLFRFGTRNEALGCTAALHSCDFNLDEAGMKSAIEAFTAFALRCE